MGESRNRTQAFDSSSDTIDLRLGQEPEMDTQRIETSPDELTFRLVHERIKQVTNPILKRVEEIWAV